jgi:hypothetical protein
VWYIALVKKPSAAARLISQKSEFFLDLAAGSSEIHVIDCKLCFSAVYTVILDFDVYFSNFYNF